MQINKEELKCKIYELYKKCREENSADRRQVLIGQLWEQSLRWCKYYLKYYFKYRLMGNDKSFEVEELGKGIFEVIKELIEMEKEPESFFSYFNNSLKNKGKEYYIDEIRKKGIKTSKPITIKIYKITKNIEEREKRRELTDNERALICISYGMDIREYERIKEMQSVDDIDILDTKINDDVGNYGLTRPNVLDPPLEELIAKFNGQIFCNAVESIIESRQKRTRGCVRALFTLHCFENMKDYDELRPVLDNKILELCEKNGKNEKKTTQKEIYREYHPKQADKSTEKGASELLKKFLADLEMYLLKNNPELSE